MAGNTFDPIRHAAQTPDFDPAILQERALSQLGDQALPSALGAIQGIRDIRVNKLEQAVAGEVANISSTAICYPR